MTDVRCFRYYVRIFSLEYMDSWRMYEFYLVIYLNTQEGGISIQSSPRCTLSGVTPGWVSSRSLKKFEGPSGTTVVEFSLNLTGPINNIFIQSLACDGRALFQICENI